MYKRLTASWPATCDKCGLPIDYGELFDLDLTTGLRRCLSCKVAS